MQGIYVKLRKCKNNFMILFYIKGRKNVYIEMYLIRYDGDGNHKTRDNLFNCIIIP